MLKDRPALIRYLAADLEKDLAAEGSGPDGKSVSEYQQTRDEIEGLRRRQRDLDDPYPIPRERLGHRFRGIDALFAHDADDLLHRYLFEQLFAGHG